MSYSRYYRLRAAKKIQDAARPHVIKGETLRWVWINIQLPLWPISYDLFMKLMSETDLDRRIEEMREGRGFRK